MMVWDLLIVANDLWVVAVKLVGQSFGRMSQMSLFDVLKFVDE
jgi:hypothetical protein